MWGLGLQTRGLSEHPKVQDMGVLLGSQGGRGQGVGTARVLFACS